MLHLLVFFLETDPTSGIYDSLANPILLTLLILLYVYIIENHKEQKNAEGGQVFESRAIDISEKRRKIGGST